jgi:hypothetical protein
MKRRDAETQRKTKGRRDRATQKFFVSFGKIISSSPARFVAMSLCRNVSVSLCLCGLFFISSLAAQVLPDEIRGYKVHKAKVSVQNSDEKTDSKDADLGVAVKFGEPKLVRVSPLGTTFEISGELTVFEQSGRIDFLTFRDFHVNGLRVRIDEYKESFRIEKGKTVPLKKPIRIFVPVSQTVKGGLKEIFDSKDEWEIAGRVFVFGRFKKFGFTFKRVVPVDAKFKILNPLKNR